MPNDDGALLATASALQRAALRGEQQGLLRGKRFAVLGEGDPVANSLFHRAATDLGAHVVTVRGFATAHATAEEIERTARMLGRLYDAIVCCAMPPALISSLRQLSDVPVYDDIAAADGPAARLAALLGGEAAAQDRQRLVLQAMLIHATA